MNEKDKSWPNVYFIRQAKLHDAGTYRVALWTFYGNDLKEFKLTVYQADDEHCRGVRLCLCAELKPSSRTSRLARDVRGGEG